MMSMKGTLLDPSRAARIRLKKSKAQETRTATEIGGARTPGSGNRWFAKGDVTNRDIVVENKRTDRGSYVLKEKELKAMCLQAYKDGKRPVLQVDFGSQSYVVITLSDAKGLGVL